MPAACPPHERASYHEFESATTIDFLSNRRRVRRAREIDDPPRTHTQIHTFHCCMPPLPSASASVSVVCEYFAICHIVLSKASQPSSQPTSHSSQSTAGSVGVGVQRARANIAATDTHAALKFIDFTVLDIYIKVASVPARPHASHLCGTHSDEQ